MLLVCPVPAGGGDQIHQPGKQDHAQGQGAHLVPGVLVHGKDQRSTDAAGSRQPQHRCFPDVDVEPLEGGGEELWGELWQHAVADAGKPGHAHGLQSQAGTQIQRVDGLREPFA